MPSTGFNIFGMLTFPQKIGDFYLWMPKTLSTRSIALELFVQFSIYGRLDLVLILISIVGGHRWFSEMGMV